MRRDYYSFTQHSATEWEYNITTPTKKYRAHYQVLKTGFVMEMLWIDGVKAFEREYDLLQHARPTVQEIVENDGKWG